MKNKQTPIQKRYVQILRPINPAPLLSKEQDMLQELFGGREENRVMFGGSGECLPQMNGALSPSNIGDDTNEETANLFGFGNNHSTRGHFGF